jgi:hypothetical protein
MKSMKGMKREFSELSNRVIGCAIEVHRILRAGLLESTYQQCLAHELKLNVSGSAWNTLCQSNTKDCTWIVATGLMS